MADEQYTRQFTKVELLTFSYNKILQRIVNQEVDVEYFKQKAKEFKHGSPQAIQAIQESLENQKNLELDRICLGIVQRKIDKYKKEKKP